MATRAPRYSDVLSKTMPTANPRALSKDPLSIARSLPKISISAASVSQPITAGTPSIGRQVGSQRSPSTFNIPPSILNPQFQQKQYAGTGLGKPNTIGKAIENWLSPSKGYNFRDVNPFREAPKGGSTSDGVFRRVWNSIF